MGGLVEYRQTLFLGAYDNVWHYYWRTDGEIPKEALFCPRKTHTPLLRHGAKENLLIPGHKSDSSPPQKRKETKTFFRHSKSGKVAFLHVWSVWQSRGLLFFSFPFPKNSVEIMESIFPKAIIHDCLILPRDLLLNRKKH